MKIGSTFERGMPSPHRQYCRTTAPWTSTSVLLLRIVTKCRKPARSSVYFKCRSDSVTNLEKQTMSISEIFAVRLEELKRADEQSQRKTQETLSRIRQLIVDTEEICLSITNLENEI